MILDNQYQLNKEFSAVTSRLMVKSVPIMKSAYSSNPDLLELLMLIPVKFEFHEISNAELTKMQEAFEKVQEASLNKKFDYDDFRIGGFIKMETDEKKSNDLVVNITLSKKEDETWDDFFKIALYNQKVTAQVAFIYLHETLHIMNRHYDFYLNNKYKKVIKRVRPDIPEKVMHQILNHAFDYYINGYLIEQAQQGHVFSTYSGNFNGLYDKNLSPNRLSQVEILESILKDAKIECTKIDGLGEMIKVAIMGNTSTLLELEGKPDLGENESRDSKKPNGEDIDSEAKEILERAYKDLLDKTREPGSSSNGTFRDLGVDYEVPVDWFHLLKGSLQALVRHHTNRSDQTWGKLKSKFRHISPMPGRIYYEDNLAAIISIDQSGSMSDSDLKKINFVINELVEKTVFVDIIIHDHKIAEIKRFQKHDKLSISEFIQKRIACGGTSHKEVFEAIREIKEKHPKLKFTYLSFSDNYSDIEQVYDTETFKNVFSFWVMTQGGIPLKNVQGVQISLEEGLLVK